MEATAAMAAWLPLWASTLEMTTSSSKRISGPLCPPTLSMASIFFCLSVNLEVGVA